LYAANAGVNSLTVSQTVIHTDLEKDSTLGPGPFGNRGDERLESGKEKAKKE
jgi:hypothetical protein